MGFPPADALAELGLASTAGLTEDELKKRYRQLALEFHPDKVRARGGDLREATEKFQRISAAHEVVRKNLPAPAVACTSPGVKAAQGPNAWVPAPTSSPFVPFLSKQVPRSRPSSDGMTGRPATPQQRDAVDALFEQAGAALRKKKAEIPKQCSFCVSSKGFTCIDEETAKTLGIDWPEYIAHPDRLGTCLTCKMAQRSVLTEYQAMQKFPALSGRPEPFAELRAEKRSFSTGGTVYYWFPDLSASVRVELRKKFGQADASATLSPEKGSGEIGGIAEALRRAATTAETADLTPTKRRQAEIGGERSSKGKGKRKKPSNDSFQDLFAGKMGSSGGFGVSSQQGPWRYRVVGENKISILTGPDVNAPASAAGHLPSGSCFLVSERKTGDDGRIYLKLLDAHGWTYNRSKKDVSKLVARESFPFEREDDRMRTTHGGA